MRYKAVSSNVSCRLSRLHSASAVFTVVSPMPSRDPETRNFLRRSGACSSLVKPMSFPLLHRCLSRNSVRNLVLLRAPAETLPQSSSQFAASWHATVCACYAVIILATGWPSRRRPRHNLVEFRRQRSHQILQLKGAGPTPIHHCLWSCGTASSCANSCAAKRCITSAYQPRAH